MIAFTTQPVVIEFPERTSDCPESKTFKNISQKNTQQYPWRGKEIRDWPCLKDLTVSWWISARFFDAGEICELRLHTVTCARATLRREFEGSVVNKCRLVAGNGRVAPLKTQSICRLELVEALIAAHLTETLAAKLMTKIEKITFRSSNYKAFVGNRVSEIQGRVSAARWRYVSKGDIADQWYHPGTPPCRTKRESSLQRWDEVPLQSPRVLAKKQSLFPVDLEVASGPGRRQEKKETGKKKINLGI